MIAKIDPANIRKALPSHIQLIAVSKNQPDEKIDAALQQGLRHFGENKVQEAIRHWQKRRLQYNDLTLHLIGPLQSNKVSEAVALFDTIQTIDRKKIALALADEMKKQARFLPCFIQVNIGDEPQKSGIAVDDLPSFYNYCVADLKMDIVGLMAIPPLDENPEPYFLQMKKLTDHLGLKQLSMGMSQDYQQAIACGATHIRIGTALFGER